MEPKQGQGTIHYEEFVYQITFLLSIFFFIIYYRGKRATRAELKNIFKVM